jgi:hypothetical protein
MPVTRGGSWYIQTEVAGWNGLDRRGGCNGWSFDKVARMPVGHFCGSAALTTEDKVLGAIAITNAIVVKSASVSSRSNNA